MSNFGGGRQGYLTITMISKEYTERSVYAFVPPHNRGDYSPKMGATQEQALETENFGQNQALFRRYAAVDGNVKNQIVTAVEPVFLSPLVDQFTVF